MTPKFFVLGMLSFVPMYFLHSMNVTSYELIEHSITEEERKNLNTVDLDQITYKRSISFNYHVRKFFNLPTLFTLPSVFFNLIDAGREDLIEYCIFKKKFDINSLAHSCTGLNVLITAGYLGNFAIVKMLVIAGAHLTLTTAPWHNKNIFYVFDEFCKMREHHVEPKEDQKIIKLYKELYNMPTLNDEYKKYQALTTCNNRILFNRILFSLLVKNDLSKNALLHNSTRRFNVRAFKAFITHYDKKILASEKGSEKDTLRYKLYHNTPRYLLYALLVDDVIPIKNVHTYNRNGLFSKTGQKELFKYHVGKLMAQLKSSYDTTFKYNGDRSFRF